MLDEMHEAQLTQYRKNMTTAGMLDARSVKVITNEMIGAVMDDQGTPITDLHKAKLWDIIKDIKSDLEIQ